MDEEKKIAVEDIQYHAQDIAKADGLSYFEKPEDAKRKEKEEERRVRAEAKRVARESKAAKKAKNGFVKQEGSDYVPMSSDSRIRIRKAILVCLIVLVSVAALGGAVFGAIHLYNTFWKTERENVLTDEERAGVLDGLRQYYFGESDAKVDEDAKAIYEHLGDIYNRYDDKEIRVLSLLRRVELLYKIDYYTESTLKDAKKAEKLDKTAKTAYWLSVVYARLGDMENAEKYSRIQSERIEQTIPKGDEQSGEG